MLMLRRLIGMILVAMAPRGDGWVARPKRREGHEYAPGH
jgi:hypothetical protein